MLICNIVGARPNFMKVAPVMEALAARGLSQILVHTGQHYDPGMSQVFFDELSLPKPDVFLGVGSDTHTKQTAKVMMGLETVFLEKKPGLVLVAGDVNSTVAAALVAAKLRIPIGHIESGLRSFDRGMPEEINRIVTDHLSDLLFTTEESGNQNLRGEGISEEKIHFVGNCMVDTLKKHLAASVEKRPWENLGLAPGEYVLLTLHRPSNVDEMERLNELLTAMEEGRRGLPVLFPVHPRTKQNIAKWGLDLGKGMTCCEPLSYQTFLGLMARAKVVVTDSGGIQEETTALGVRCLTLRANTERPATILQGTNRLVPGDRRQIVEALTAALSNRNNASAGPPLWDGRAGVRTAEVVEKWIASRP